MTGWQLERSVAIRRRDGSVVTDFTSPLTWQADIRRQLGAPAVASAAADWDCFAHEDHHRIYGRPWLLGRLIFEELRRRGIPRDLPFLDLGCGAGRMAIHLIPYLQLDLYCGVDSHLASLAALSIYEARLHGLAEFGPRLLWDDDFAVDAFETQFASVLDVAVTMHLGQRRAIEAYSRVRSCMQSGGRLFITHKVLPTEAEMRGLGFALKRADHIEYELPWPDAGKLARDDWFEFEAV